MARIDAPKRVRYDVTMKKITPLTVTLIAFMSLLMAAPVIACAFAGVGRGVLLFTILGGVVMACLFDEWLGKD